jgi:tetratricopeptide (TPR) repeat protein
MAARNREEFLRSLGLTSDDVKDPEGPAPSNMPRRAAQSPMSVVSAVPTSNATFSKPSSAFSSTSMSGPAGRSGASSAREEFLRSLGIDNAQHPDGAGEPEPSMQQRRGSDVARPSMGRRAQPQREDSMPTSQHSEYVSRSESTREALRRVDMGGDDDMDRSARMNRSYGDLNSTTGSLGSRRAGSSMNMSATMSGTVSGVPILDPQGREVPPDATADDLKRHGNTYYEQGDFRKAIRFYTRALERDPRSEALYSNRSAAYLQGSKQMGIDTRSMALRDADKVAELRPDWFKGHARRGDALFKLERFEEAVEAYTTAQRLDPGNPSLQASINEARSFLGRNATRDSSSAWAREEATRRARGAARSVHSMAEEFHAATERLNGEALTGDSVRERHLAKWRQSKGLDNTTSSTTRGSSPAPSYHEPSAPSTGYNSAPPSASKEIGNVNLHQLPQGFDSSAAAAYQNSLLEAYRLKKAMAKK